MRVFAAYIGIVLLWSTTPLAIQWSGTAGGFIFGAASRMVLGAVCLSLFMLLARRKLPLHQKALQTYLAIVCQIFGAMMCVYWGSQFIPSGWVSVIFGLSPITSAIFALIWLKEQSLTPGKVTAYILGLSGLLIMFHSALQMNLQAVYGICGVLSAVSLQTASAVWVKRIHAGLPAYAQVTGGLLLSLPLYLSAWIFFADAAWPTQWAPIALGSILYLGLLATTVGFTLYYYVLLHLPAPTVGLIPMISPVLALYLGHHLNHEAITSQIMIGTGLILCSLLLHEFFDRYWGKAYRRKTQP